MRQNNKKVILVLGLGTLAASVAGCGKSKPVAAGTGVTGVTSVSGLPKSTGPVAGLKASVLRQEGLVTAKATQGILLSDLGTVQWSGKSRPYCESGRQIREAIKGAADGDKTLCYIGLMGKYKLFNGDIYDGTSKYYTLNNMSAAFDTQHAPPSNFVPRVKFKIQKSNSGTISKFEMFSCFNQNPGGSMIQDSYNNMDLSNPAAVSINAVSSGSGNNYTYGNRFTVKGAIDANSAWTSKTLSATSSDTMSGQGFTGTYGSSISIQQFADRFDLTGYMMGTYGTQTFTANMAAIIQGINMDKISTMALGDGSAKYSLSFANSAQGGQTYNQVGVNSWNGDSAAALTPSTSGDYYTDVNAKVLGSVGSPSVSFAQSEVWDCNPESAFAQADFSSLSSDDLPKLKADFAACEASYGGENNSWVNCDGGN